MDDDRYVLAVKREKRPDVPRDWVETVRGTPGVVILGDANPARLQIQATPEAIETIRRALGDCIHIEKVTPRARY